MSERVLVAMSGGVDSSVAAAVVAERGDEAVGVTMRLLPKGGTGFGCCGSPADVDDARRVCERLGIRHYVVDLAEAFESTVIRPFVEAYLDSQTPNPCVECNRAVKFGRLHALARAWGCARVATGHYARVEGGRLLKSFDAVKDQTYFLYSLTPRELGSVEFPVGGMEKEKVREKARALGLATADKAESQEVCFVPSRNVRDFLASRPESTDAPGFKPGPVVDEQGRVVGEHAGLAGITVGQRRGLGLSGGAARYVVRLDPDKNSLVVGAPEEIFATRFAAANVSWTGNPPAKSFRAAVRVRHRHPPAAATIDLQLDGTVKVALDEPQRAVSPGQSAVFYDGEAVLGGGTIMRGVQR